MKKEMKWGLATLILLLGIAAVFLFIDKDTNTEPKMTLGQPTKDLLKQGVKSPPPAETPVAVEEPPPSKEAQSPSSENSGMHPKVMYKNTVQDGVLYDENHNPINMTPELEDTLDKQAKRGFLCTDKRCFRTSPCQVTDLARHMDWQGNVGRQRKHL